MTRAEGGDFHLTTRGDLTWPPAGTLPWPRTSRAAREGSSSLSTGDYDELKRLRAEVAELRMERDVLKRSVVLWVKEATK